MTNRIAETSPLIYARVAGFLHLGVIVGFGIFAESIVRGRLIVPGDAVATVNNIMADELLFRMSFASGLIRMIALLLLALVLYKVLKSVNKNLALLMVIFVIVTVSIQSINMLNQFAVLLLLSGADYLTVFPEDQLYAQVMLFLDLHEHGYHIASIFFGLWLLPLGVLVFKSGFLPRILGILLIIGAFGHVLNSFTIFLFPTFDLDVGIISIVEILFPLWLLIKGVNVEQWEKGALESA